MLQLGAVVESCFTKSRLTVKVKAFDQSGRTRDLACRLRRQGCAIAAADVFSLCLGRKKEVVSGLPRVHQVSCR